MKPDTLDMFGPDVDYGKPRPSLARARELVAAIELLETRVDETWRPEVCRIAEEARQIGAHSVARAARWLASYRLWDKGGWISMNGPDAAHWHVEDCARRWLARQERARA